MRISELSESPKIGDIVEFETDPDTVVEGLVVGVSPDGYIYEFSESGLRELEEACTYGKYYCSTDKKWKCRQGPKQSRSVSEDQNPKDTVTMDVPFLLRVMEYAREDAETDLDLHTAAERLIAASQRGQTLTMADYDDIFGMPVDDEMTEAEYQGHKVTLGKPTRGDVKKFKVYVRDPNTGNVRKINFGHGGTSAKRLGQKTMRIKKSNPARRRSFRARHRCHTAKDRLTARYWSCRAW